MNYDLVVKLLTDARNGPIECTHTRAGPIVAFTAPELLDLANKFADLVVKEVCSNASTPYMSEALALHIKNKLGVT